METNTDHHTSVRSEES